MKTTAIALAILVACISATEITLKGSDCADIDYTKYKLEDGGEFKMTVEKESECN